MALLVVIVALAAVAAGLFAGMVRRNDALLGLAGLIVTIAAAVAAVVFAGVDSV